MQISKFNISKPRKYTTRAGEEKTQWNNIGTLTEFHKDDGSISRILEIPAISLEANVFPFQEKDEQAPRASRATATDAPRDPLASAFDEDIDPLDIPF